MTTIIEDNELNEELQELYLMGKQRISDLEFMQTDIKIFQTLLEKTFLPSTIKKQDIGAIGDLRIKAEIVENAVNSLKTSVLNYLHVLEPLIVEINQSFQVSLIEIESNLNIQYYKVMLEYRLVKNAFLDLNKQRSKEDFASLKR